MNRQSSKFHNLIIDGSNLYHRAYYIGKVNYEQDNRKNKISHYVIISALQMLDKVLKEFSYNDSVIYLLFDNSQSKIVQRKEIDPTYKSNRDKLLNDKELYTIHNNFIEILKRRSDQYRILMAGTLEADDLVKPLIENIKSYRKTNLMISNDMDWARNISDSTLWYNWTDVFDKTKFYSKYKFFPTEETVKLYKSVNGDPSDNIVQAVKISSSDLEKILEDCQSFKTINDFVKYVNQMEEGKLKQSLKSNIKVIMKNYSLVDFIELSIPVSEYIKVCKFEPVSLRLFLQALNIPIPEELQTPEEVEKSFFD